MPKTVAPPANARQQDAKRRTAEASFDYSRPPQSAGIPQRLYSLGPAAGDEKPNAALRVLHDPVARNSLTRIYSGQRRGWNR
jgi:hypothetical protein